MSYWCLLSGFVPRQISRWDNFWTPRGIELKFCMVPYLDDLLGKWIDGKNWITPTTPTTLPPTKLIRWANFHNFHPILTKLGMEVNFGGKRLKWTDGVAGPIFRPPQPPYQPPRKPPPITNFGNFGPKGWQSPGSFWRRRSREGKQWRPSSPTLSTTDDS